MFFVAEKMSLYELGRGSPLPPPPFGYAHAHVKALTENFISGILQQGNVNCSLNSLFLGQCRHSISVSAIINYTNMAATSDVKLDLLKSKVNF